jgi:Tfp pilus assembly protein PilN
MPLVNLIAVQRSERRTAIRRLRVTTLVWLVELAACITVIGGLMWQAAWQEARLADLKAKSQSMEPYKQAIADGNRELRELKPRLVTLQEAGRYTDQWIRVLAHLSTRVPDGTWLTTIRVQEPKTPDKPPEVSFIGYSLDQNRVGELMMRLNECEDLSTLNLKYTAEKESGDNSGVEFEIYSSLTSSSAEAKKDEANARS